MQISMTVNGSDVTSEIEPRVLLVHYIREVLGLTGTHWGCDTSNCGTCVVLMDGQPVKSCTVLAAMAAGHDIRTVEGLATGDKLHPVQEAFLECGAMQCAYCTPGMIVSAVGFLESKPEPTREEIVSGMNGNICRCGTYTRIVTAVEKAAQAMKGGAK